MDAMMRELSGVLRGLAGEVAAGEPVGLLVRAVLDGGASIGVSECGGVGVWAGLREGMGKTWDVRRDFALACGLRAYGVLGERMEGAVRRAAAESLREALAAVERRARESGANGVVVVGERLWGHWLLVLGREVLGRGVEERVLGELWKAGTAGQDGEGRLHRWDAEGSLDGFVWDELVALHAAANGAVALGRAEMMEVVHGVARYHVANTQPDNTMNMPWGLAGFALFADTRSFAEQQLHDVRAAWVGRSGDGARVRAAGLVADAVVTLTKKPAF